MFYHEIVNTSKRRMMMLSSVLLLALLTDMTIAGTQTANQLEEDVSRDQSVRTCLDEEGIVVDQNKCVIIHVPDTRVHTLDCAHKNLHHVPVSSLQTCKKVNFVDLSYNYIKDIPNIDNLFSGVVTLNISHNRINTIDFLMSLASVAELLYLDVASNHLEHIPKHTGHLEVLILSGNLIESWDNITLSPALKEMYLDNNMLEAIGLVTCGLNSELNIEVLNLTNNRITDLNGDAFRCFTTLTRLYVASNSIMEIQTGTFDKCRPMELLDLSTNKLRSLPQNLFQPLQKLKYLDLSHNKLVSVPDQIPMLVWLDLSFNRIRTIPEEMSRSLYPQDVFLLGGNPLVCDCEMLWLKELYETREYLLKHMKVDQFKFIPVCVDPPKLANKHWDELEDDMFKCSNSINHDTDLTNTIVDDISIAKESLTAAVVGSDFVTLTWTAKVHLEHDSVSISHHEFSKRDKTKSLVLPLSKTRFRIKCLKPNTPYIFCLDYVLASRPVVSRECIEIMTAVPYTTILYMIYLMQNNVQSILFFGGMFTCVVLICMFKSYKRTKLKTS